nr:nonstructural protein 2B [West Nile virus]
GWPATEVMTAVGLMFAIVGGLAELDIDSMAIPMTIAGLMFAAFVISGKSTDMWIERTADISWESDAEITGSSERVDVRLDDDGNFQLMNDPGAPWKIWMLRMVCLAISAYTPWAILPSVVGFWITLQYTKR